MTLIKSLLRNTYFWVLLWIIWMGIIFAFSHIPGSETYYEPTLEIILERKGAHVVEYAVLFLLSVQVFSLLFFQESLRRIILLAFAWSLAYGVLDELHQFYTPYRGAHMQDVAVDVLGISVGFLVVAGMYYFQRKKTLE